MPPSTVFSYWRRRSNAPLVPPALQPTSKVLGSSSPPQLPLITDSTTLTATFDEKFTTREGRPSPADYFANFDGGNTTVSVSAIDAPSSSTATLTAEASSSEDHTRPRSSPEEQHKETSTLTSQSDYSQPSLAPETPDRTNENSSKATSPYQLSTGRSPLSPQPVDGQPMRSASPGMAPPSHRRFLTSPEESPGDKVSGSQREYRFEGPTSRRLVDRDVQPVEPVPLPQRSGKTMLHLLNPMSLLAKRRAHQMAGLRPEDVSKGSRNLVPAIPDDYDPRIRGHIVHDFSAPRPRRPLSAAPVPSLEPTNQPSVSSGIGHDNNGNELSVRASDSGGIFANPPEQGKKHCDHSPVFKEHFEDDKRALQVENKAYLQSSLLTDPSNRDHNPHAIPVFARKLPSSIIDNGEKPLDEQSKPSSRTDVAVDKPTEVEEDPDTFDIEQPQQPSGLPKHFKSNASRFSFDMNGVGSSTQEKLLEEKHKEKEAARKAQARLNGEFSDIEDDYDNDMFDDMDGLEEEIPGVNVDADEDDHFRDFSGPGNILNKSWLAPNLSPVVASPIQPDMPSTQNGQLPPSETQGLEQPTAPLTQDVSILADDASESSKTFLRESKDFSAAPLQSGPDEDDLYFDDGEFGELDAEQAGDRFDESIFDDPTSHLYDRKQTAKSVPSDQPGPEEHGPEGGSTGGLRHVPSVVSDHHQGFAPRRYGSVVGNAPNLELAVSHAGVLSEHNLEAFHNALADAANRAATKGHLEHTTSTSERSLGQESTTHTLDSQPGLISDESRVSQVIDPVIDPTSFEEAFEDFDYDDNDDLLYDDPIIAAANAEALENDDEGIYGQEFGFYAQAYGNGSELTHGGYFGPRGVEGISRSHSGGGKFREPSLTPITERSEWSTRNSIISVAAHGVAHSNQSVPSPGLAQLVDIGSLDDELSLGALMKLRRDAWGGSNGSLRSSSGSPPPQQNSTSNRASFAFSDVSPTVHTVPPDFLGSPNSIDSPVRESDRGAWGYHVPQQRTERPAAGESEP
ncbi:uncharacterized protein BJX67DRAFT_355067 [Aspergillus lucknowensis]|uniref:Uncharacterized protein n=1 Tax=Aspergillus lucknowensis TaxID=176173 RepID=A0ABR4LPT8_9EURO